jgi:hypothetical protein
MRRQELIVAVWLAGVGAVLFAGMAAADATFQETSISLKTYVYDSYLVQCPPAGYEIYPFDRFPYDYLNYDSYMGNTELREYSAIVLENGYLQLTVVPELGGRILRMVNKATGHNEFYDNPAGIKPAPFGYLGPPPRGDPPWWVATGGTEFFFPVDEHGYVFYRPFEYEAPEDLGSRVVFHQWCQEEISGNPRWRVDLRIELADESASYTVTQICRNNSDQQEEFQYWSNSMVSPGPGNITVSPTVKNMNQQLILPQNVDYVLDHNGWNYFIGGNPEPGDGWKEVSWPYHTSGFTVNLSRVQQWWDMGLNLGGLFTPPGYDVKFQGVYNLEADEGFVRVFPSQIVPGVDSGAKFFLYSHSVNDYWSQYSDMSGGEMTTYIEMMGGPNRIFYYPTNPARPVDPRLFFEAGESFSWIDRYYSPHGIGTVVKATHRAALNFDVPPTATIGEQITFMLGVFPLTPHSGGSVEIDVGGTLIFDSGPLEISPGTVPGPYSHTRSQMLVDVPTGSQEIRMTYRFPDGTKEEVIHEITIIPGVIPTPTGTATSTATITPTFTESPTPTVTPTPSVTPTPPPAGNELLQNPGFEEDGTDFVLPPAHWGFAGTGSDPADDADGTLRLRSFPQFFTPPRSGVFSAGKYTEYGIHRGFFLQRVAARPGGTYACTAYGYVPGSGGSPGRLRLGVDPSGGTDPTSANVIWTDYVSPFGNYALVGFSWPNTVTASGHSLTLFLELRQPISAGGNAMLFDDASVVELGAPMPTPTEIPSPVPTETATPTPLHTRTPLPSPTITLTPGGDTDQDGLLDVVEGGRYPPEDKTHMYLPDSDGDGLLDGIEDANHDGAWQSGAETNPRSWDTDGDGYEDRIETGYLASDPLDPMSPGTLYVDGDQDGLPQSLDPDDLVADIDADRFLDGYEAAVLDLSAVENAGVVPPLGDVDGSGTVSSLDVQMMLNFFASRETPGMQPANADLDRNGQTDNVDAQLAVEFFTHEFETLPFHRQDVGGAAATAPGAVLSIAITDAAGNPLSTVSAHVNDPAIGGADFVVALETTDATALATYSQRIHFDARLIRFRDGGVQIPLEAGVGRRRGIVAVNVLAAEAASQAHIDVSGAGIKGFSGPQTLVRLGFDVVSWRAQGEITLESDPNSSGTYMAESAEPIAHEFSSGALVFQTVEGPTGIPSLMLR